MDLEKIDSFYSLEYSFCNRYEGLVFCHTWGKGLCLLRQIIDHYSENELYLVKYNPQKLINFAVNFLNELDECCRMNDQIKKELVRDFHYCNTISFYKVYMCYRKIHYFYFF